MDDFDLVCLIVDRAEELDFEPASYDRSGLIFDLMSANGKNENPKLDYYAMIRFEDGSFMHDVCGIYENLNRTSGKLENCFLPRCAKSEVKE